mgnify:CR=1 FL=1
MSMIDTVRSQMMEAMKNKDKTRKDALSMLLSALKNKAIDKRADLTEAEEFEVVKREIRQTKETMDLAPADRYSLMERCMATENQYLHENECPIGYPKVKETLLALSKTHRLFIVSNSQQGYPELCISKLGLTGCITGHLCFGDTGTGKGQTIRTLMEKHAVSSCAYIGDTQGDYEATVEAGVPFIWASYGFGTPAGYAGKIDSFTDLLKL